jgi:hypothetical protein
VGTRTRIVIRLVLLSVGLYLASWHVAFVFLWIVPAVSGGLPGGEIWQMYLENARFLWARAQSERSAAMQMIALCIFGFSLVVWLGASWIAKGKKTRAETGDSKQA